MAIALLIAFAVAVHLAWRVRTLSSQLVHARLTVLSMELRPHFLLNALNAVAELVYADPEAADGTITALGHLLAHSLRHQERHEIPLGEEIGLLRDYALVERTRFGKGLHVEIDIPASLHGVRVPPMILQPLVENAVRHGIGPTGMCGTVRVVGGRHGASLRLQVIDRGAGFRPAPRQDSGGVGLSNVRARLQALYGSDQSVDISSRPGKGTSVTLVLPWRQERGWVADPQAPLRECLALLQ